MTEPTHHETLNEAPVHMGRVMDQLSPREKEVAELLVRGLTNKQIGTILFVSEHTVHSHLAKMFNKVGVRSRIVFAVKYSLSEGSRPR